MLQLEQEIILIISILIVGTTTAIMKKKHGIELYRHILCAITIMFIVVCIISICHILGVPNIHVPNNIDNSVIDYVAICEIIGLSNKFLDIITNLAITIVILICVICIGIMWTIYFVLKKKQEIIEENNIQYDD